MNNAVVHPLRGAHTTRSETFEDWSARWNQTDNFDERMGLLHGLMSNHKLWNAGQREKIVPFLFTLADGYLQPRSFFGSVDDADYKHYSSSSRREAVLEERSLLSQMAMTVLVARFFRRIKQPPAGADCYRWWWIVTDEAVFRKVLWFFREVKSHGKYGIPNLPTFRCEGERESVDVVEFLLELCDVMWGFAPGHYRWSDHYPNQKPIQARLASGRSSMIKILVYQGNLAWLFHRKLDHASKMTLKEISLRKPSSFRKDDGTCEERVPKNLSEAIMQGDLSASLLNAHVTKMVELRRVKNRVRKHLKAQNK